MVAEPLREPILGVGVGGAVDGGPELIVGGVIGDHVLGGVERGGGGGGFGGGGEGQGGVVHFWGSGFGGERDYPVVILFILVVVVVLAVGLFIVFFVGVGLE